MDKFKVGDVVGQVRPAPLYFAEFDIGMGQTATVEEVSPEGIRLSGPTVKCRSLYDPARFELVIPAAPEEKVCEWVLRAERPKFSAQTFSGTEAEARAKVREHLEKGEHTRILLAKVVAIYTAAPAVNITEVNT